MQSLLLRYLFVAIFLLCTTPCLQLRLQQMRPTRRGCLGTICVSFVCVGATTTRTAAEGICDGDRLGMEATVPGAYMNPCYTLPSRSVKQGDGSILTVDQASTSQGMTGRTGVAVWNSCLLLSRFIANLASSPQLLSLFEVRRMEIVEESVAKAHH